MSPLWRQQKHGRMSRAEGLHGSVVIAALRIFLNHRLPLWSKLTRRQLWLSCIIVTPWTAEVRFDSLHHHSQTGVGPNQYLVEYVHPWVQSRERDTEHSPLFNAKAKIFRGLVVRPLFAFRTRETSCLEGFSRSGYFRICAVFVEFHTLSRNVHQLSEVYLNNISQRTLRLMKRSPCRTSTLKGAECSTEMLASAHKTTRCHNTEV
jgi:hypothetical protein